MVSLLNILNSDNEEAQKAAVCETVHVRVMFSMVPGRMNKSIRGMKALPSTTSRSMTMLIVVDLARLQTRLAPLFPTWKSTGCSNSLDTIANPLGLCRFYWTDPQKSNVITGLKSAASTCRIKRLLELAKELGQPLTIMVFKGGMVTLLGLLQELHSCLTLSCIPDPHSQKRWKWDRKTMVSCCPICAYVIKNDYTFLNHIIIGHYWSSFSCGKCLEFAVSSRTANEETLP